MEPNPIKPDSPMENDNESVISEVTVCEKEANVKLSEENSHIGANQQPGVEQKKTFAEENGEKEMDKAPAPEESVISEVTVCEKEANVKLSEENSHIGANQQPGVEQKKTYAKENGEKEMDKAPAPEGSLIPDLADAKVSMKEEGSRIKESKNPGEQPGGEEEELLVLEKEDEDDVDSFPGTVPISWQGCKDNPDIGDYPEYSPTVGLSPDQSPAHLSDGAPSRKPRNDRRKGDALPYYTDDKPSLKRYVSDADSNTLVKSETLSQQDAEVIFEGETGITDSTKEKLQSRKRKKTENFSGEAADADVEFLCIVPRSEKPPTEIDLKERDPLKLYFERTSDNFEASSSTDRSDDKITEEELCLLSGKFEASPEVSKDDSLGSRSSQSSSDMEKENDNEENSGEESNDSQSSVSNKTYEDENDQVEVSDEESNDSQSSSDMEKENDNEENSGEESNDFQKSAENLKLERKNVQDEEPGEEANGLTFFDAEAELSGEDADSDEEEDEDPNEEDIQHIDDNTNYNEEELREEVAAVHHKQTRKDDINAIKALKTKYTDDDDALSSKRQKKFNWSCSSDVKIAPEQPNDGSEQNESDDDIMDKAISMKRPLEQESKSEDIEKPLFKKRKIQTEVEKSTKNTEARKRFSMLEKK
ncbi:enolase-phosphatase E1-like isoform X2 [Uloborus diversus]|uniref:enolase-phosphatase E1-like isoform X2 n=1 Tax=Uloborus diversus TaxID=327109 RepID=UPI002409C3C3|nr:enolase-phosphatase E1-like isoform X2 [Uloborus diversus]